MYRFEGEDFETKADMLQYALEESILSSGEVFAEFEELDAKETVQATLDYGNVDRVCEALLDFEEVA